MDGTPSLYVSSTIRRLLSDVVTLVRLALTPRARLAAENLFLRKQLALYHERGVKARRSDPETRAVGFVLHDRDSIYAATVDRAIASMGRHVLTTPARTPQAHAFCERVIGTLRRECLDWLIPIHEGHLRLVLGEWMTHYNRGRPHASLGPGIPEPVPDADQVTCTGHRLPAHTAVIATPILGGLHHEYRLARRAA